MKSVFPLSDIGFLLQVFDLWPAGAMETSG
jgi:hypothetical protein